MKILKKRLFFILIVEILGMSGKLFNNEIYLV